MAQKTKRRTLVQNEEENGGKRLTDKDLIELEEDEELHLDTVETVYEKDEHGNGVIGGNNSDLVYEYKWNEVVWRNVILLGMLHVAAVYAWFLFMIDDSIKWQTSVATFVFGLFSSSLGITAGAHRLWSHRSYKAKWPLRYEFYLLMYFSFLN